jgi:hypothetical protein
MALRLGGICSGLKLIRSRTATGAVRWLIPRVKNGMGREPEGKKRIFR